MIQKKPFHIKFRYLFLPFIISLICLVVGYTFLNWLIFLELKLISLKDFWVNYIFPIGLATILVFAVLRKYFKILRLETTNGNLRDFYSYLLLGILAVPTVICQNYLVEFTGDLTELSTPLSAEISELESYCTISDYFIDESQIIAGTEFKVSGRRSENFNMRIYTLVPILENQNQENSILWLGTKYKKQIKNSLSRNEKEAVFEAFALECDVKIQNTNYKKFEYFKVLGNSDDLEQYLSVLEENQIDGSSKTILIGETESFSSRLDGINWTYKSLIIGLLVWIVMIAIPKINLTEFKRIAAGKPDLVARAEFKDFFEIFIPSKDFFISPILLNLNLIVYLLMVICGVGFISFGSQELLNWGGNFRPYVLDGEWWRLLTSMFLHGGLMHVLINCFSLIFIGMFLEPLLGKVKFLACYLVTGIIASLSSIYWYEETVSIGASGAIFGITGVFLAFSLFKYIHTRIGGGLLIVLLIFIGFNLLSGLTGGVDNAAHIGGLLSGFVIGLFLGLFSKDRILMNQDVS